MASSGGLGERKAHKHHSSTEGNYPGLIELAGRYLFSFVIMECQSSPPGVRLNLLNPQSTVHSSLLLPQIVSQRTAGQRT